MEKFNGKGEVDRENGKFYRVEDFETFIERERKTVEIKMTERDELIELQADLLKKKEIEISGFTRLMNKIYDQIKLLFNGRN